MRALLTGIGLLVLGLLVGLWLIEEVEVATLVTFDLRDRSIESELWIVDLAGAAWVRAPMEGTRWLARARRQPRIRLSRGDGVRTVRAVPLEDAKTRDAVNRAFDAKYGAFERAARILRDPERAVPVRLDPVPSS